MRTLKMISTILVASFVPTVAMAAQARLGGLRQVPELGMSGFGQVNSSTTPSYGGSFTPTGQLYGPNSAGPDSMNNDNSIAP
jgi:hypothetical protein